MKTILLSSFILVSFISKSQDPTIEWMRTYNGPGELFDEANAVAMDPSDGSIVIAGKTYGAVGQVNTVVVKYNAAGDLLWEYIWDGPFSKDDNPWDMKIGSEGQIYVCGQSMTGDGYWDSDMFILAIDNDGGFMWDDTYGNVGTFLDIAYEMRIGSDGKIYIAGQDDQGETNLHYYGGVMLRYTQTGDIDWTINFNASGEWPYTDTFHGLDLDNNNHVILCGAITPLNNFYDLVTVSYGQDGSQLWMHANPGPDNTTSESNTDVIADENGNVYSIGYNSSGIWEVEKFNSSGVYQWTYTLDGFYFDYETMIDQMVLDGAGNLYFAVSANGEIIVVKLLPDGTEAWQTIWASPSGFADDVFELVIDFQENLYVAGRAGFANSYYDMLLLKLDNQGNLIYDVNYEGLASQNDEAKGVVVSPDGSAVYLVGYTRGVTPNADLTIVKYAQTVGVVEKETNQFSLFPNPASEKLNIKFHGEKMPLQIYDLTGQMIWSGMPDGANVIDISHFSPGAYYITSEVTKSIFIKS